MLGSEFSRYIGWQRVLFFDIIYVIGPAILIWQIRKGIQKEMEELADIVKLKKEINEM